MIGNDSNGTPILVFHQAARGPRGQRWSWGTLVVTLAQEGEENRRGQPLLEETRQQQVQVLKLLIEQLGGDCDAVVNNEGPEHRELRDYLPYTLEQCQGQVDYCLHTLYIHNIREEQGRRVLWEHLF